jgi:KUP system potassium uptake protein
MVTITRTALPNCYRFLIRHGYNDVIINDGLSELVYTELRKFLLASHVDIHRTVKITGTSDDDIAYARDVASSADSNTGLTRRLQTLETAKETQMVYVVGKEQLRVLKDKNNIFKRAVLDAFLWIRENTRTKVANLRLPVGKLVEIGFVKEL